MGVFHMATDPEKWLEKYGDLLYRFSVVRVGDRAVAEDLVQETLLSAFEAREQFHGLSSEKTWLIGILKHKIADYFRRTSREIQAADEAGQRSGDEIEIFDRRGHWKTGPEKWKGTPEKILEDKEFWKVLHHCLDGLSPNAKRAFVLREMDGMESGEICKVLGISPTNLWVTLHRARSSLRRCMELNWIKETR